MNERRYQPMTDVGVGKQPLTDEFARDWVQRCCDAWNSHRAENLVAVANPDVHWEDPGIYPDGVSVSRDFLTSWVAHLLGAVPDLQLRIIGEPLVDLDRSRLIFEWENSGHMTGPSIRRASRRPADVCVARGLDSHSFRDGLLSASGRSPMWAPSPGRSERCPHPAAWARSSATG
ncbi:MAG: hypothetical protein QOC85_3989 [Streptomyces sp.]|nr:hypothetical protein [Streptomyces sp.]